MVRTLLTVKQFSEKHSAFGQVTLRNFMVRSTKNGFEDVIVRVSRRKVLIDEKRFFEWVDRRAEAARKVPAEGDQ